MVFKWLLRYYIEEEGQIRTAMFCERSEAVDRLECLGKSVVWWSLFQLVEQS